MKMCELSRRLSVKYNAVNTSGGGYYTDLIFNKL